MMHLQWRLRYAVRSWRFSASPQPSEIPRPAPGLWTGFSARLAGRTFQSPWRTPTSANNRFTQRRYAEGGHFARASHPKAVDFILDQIRRYPGEITLIAIGPLMNVGAVIDKEPETFRKLRRVVLMGGSIYRGYGDMGYFPPHGPQAEWNIVNDIPSAQKLFAAGVPLYVMPLDSTQLKLDEVKRAILFQSGTPLTDALTLLYHEWGQETPTLFDVMTVAYILDSNLCPVQPMHIRVDDKGFTRPEPGAPDV